MHSHSVLSIYRLSKWIIILSQIMASENVAAIVEYVKLTPNALPPTRGSLMAAGLDFKIAYVTIPAYGKGVVETDLAILVPSGCYGRIVPRSGLVLHHHMSVGGGVTIVEMCVCVILFNHSGTPFQIHRRGRVAQLICEKIVYPEICEVKRNVIPEVSDHQDAPNSMFKIKKF